MILVYQNPFHHEGNFSKTEIEKRIRKKDHLMCYRSRKMKNCIFKCSFKWNISRVCYEYISVVINQK